MDLLKTLYKAYGIKPFSIYKGKDGGFKLIPITDNGTYDVRIPIGIEIGGDDPFAGRELTNRMTVDGCDITEI